MAGDYNSILFKYEGEVAPSAIGSLKAMRDHLRDVTVQYQSGQMSLAAYQQRVATVNADLAAFGGSGGTVQQTFRSFGMLDRMLGSQVAGLFGLNHQWGIVAEQFSRFATGGLATTGILAGFAAIALAVKSLGSDLEETGKQTETLVQQWDKVMSKVGSGAAQRRPGELRLADIQIEMARLRGLPAGMVFDPKFGAMNPVTVKSELEALQNEANLLVAAFQRATVADRALGEAAKETNDKIIRGIRDAMAPLNDPRLQADIRNVIRSIAGPNEQEVAQGEADILTGGQLAAMETWQKVHNAFREEGRKARERMKATEERAWRQFGLSLGNAFINGLVESLSHGFRDFGGMLKSLILEGIKIAAEYGLRVALAHALGPAGAVAGGAADTIMSNGGNPAAAVLPGSAGMDFSNFPAARDPLSMARDATWQTFLRQSNRVAEHGGARSLR